MANVVIYALIGKLLIYLAQSFPFQDIYFIGKWFSDEKFLGKMLACDLCIGVWIYFLLAICCKYSLFGYSLFGQFLTGASMSFVMYIFTTGWQLQFGITEIK